MSLTGARGASVLHTATRRVRTSPLATRNFTTTRARAQQQQQRKPPPSWINHIKYGAGVAVVAGVVSFALTSVGHLSQKVYAEAGVPTSSEWHTDPSTSLQLPRRISNNASTSPYILIASGVRTVSFLRIQVYVASLYMDEESLQRFLATKAPTQNLEQLLNTALESGVPCILKITPVRNTDFAHLRDGFARAIQLRLKYLRKETTLTQEQEESLAVSLQKLKECFPKSSLKKGENLDIVLERGERGGVDLSLVHDGTVLGRVQYDVKGGELDLGKLLLKAYAADKEPVSDVFKKALEERLLY